MQGGHPDGLRFRLAPSTEVDPRGGAVVAAQQASSGNESEVSVADLVTLGARLDGIVATARRVFSLMLALPVCWFQLQPSIESMRAHKLARVHDGTQTILAIQRHRTRTLDILAQLVSFCAEEEFYLIVLPILFWCVDYELARRLTYVVVFGLFCGNVIKDVFELPRPTNVWRPTNQASIDSTALEDFGFPSTHSMNGVSNSLYCVYHVLRRKGYEGNPAWVVAAAAAWILGLSSSRLYLGVHTPTDVRGGLVLGFIVLATMLLTADSFDAFVARQSSVALALAGVPVSVGLLLVCPQPRPPTPTFHQNALLVGLAWGTVAGARAAMDLSLDRDGVLLLTSNPWINTLIVASGFVLVVIVRQIVKKVITGLVVATGVKLVPEANVLERRLRQNPKRKARRVRIFTRDIDLIGVAVIKTIVYASVAFGITCFIPWTLRAGVQRVYSYDKSY
jgi:membrane-associated phospholipid phosphatase